jgi:cytochrome o ubiquinol oxidase operon protein cyoD
MELQTAKEKRRLITYITGFIFSIILTLVAYYAVTQHIFTRNILVIYIIGLALIQFAVQLLYFLHLGEDTKPRFKTMVFLLMLMVVLIVVVGSLWIMHNLDYRMMPDQHHVNDYLKSQDGL